MQRALGWSAFGMDAYRMGDWKVVRLPEPYGNGTWQLYDLTADPGEKWDLAVKYPERITALIESWEAYADENGVIIPDKPTFYSRPVDGKKF